MAVKRKKITIVGCGPGSRDYLTPAAAAAVSAAEVLIGAPRLLDLFPDQQAERIAMGKDRESILQEISARLGKRRIAILVTGDPGLYSLAASVVKRFGRETCEILPGISALQTAFARMGASWEDARIISAHAANPELDSSELSKYPKIAIFGGDRDLVLRLSALFKDMREKGYRVFVAEDLTLPEERFYEITGEGGRADRSLSTRAIIMIVRKEIL